MYATSSRRRWNFSSRERRNCVSSTWDYDRAWMNLIHRKLSARRIKKDDRAAEFYQNFQPVYRTPPEKDQLKDQLDNSFHQAISPVATFVQFLALMPVCGVSHDDSKALKFKWTSKRAIYTLVYIGYGIFISVFFLTFLLDLGISAKNIGWVGWS